MRTQIAQASGFGIPKVCLVYIQRRCLLRKFQCHFLEFVYVGKRKPTGKSQLSPVGSFLDFRNGNARILCKLEQEQVDNLCLRTAELGSEELSNITLANINQIRLIIG